MHQSVGSEWVATYMFGGSTTCCQCQWVQLLSRETPSQLWAVVIYHSHNLRPVAVWCGKARISYCDIYHFSCHWLSLLWVYHARLRRWYGKGHYCEVFSWKLAYVLFWSLFIVFFGVWPYHSCCSKKEYWITIKVCCSNWEGWFVRKVCVKSLGLGCFWVSGG
jgi:hypothetical protein